jgi:HAMP domain-containing protein
MIRSISIRYAIPGLFAILIAVALGITAFLGFRSGQQAVEDLATRLGKEKSVRIAEHVVSFLETPQLFHQVNLAAIDSGSLDLSDYEELERSFYNQVYITDAVPYVYLGTEEGYFLGVDKTFGEGEAVFKIVGPDTAGERYTYALDEEGNRIEELTDERGNYDPRIRPWYQAGAEMGKATWSEIYVFSARPVLGISPVAPVYDEDGNLKGVLGIDLTLSELTDFLRTIEISPTGEAYIMEHNGELVALSSEELPFFTNDEGNQQQLLATESADLVISSTAQTLVEEFGSFEAINTSQVTMTIDGELQYVQVHEVNDGRGLNWLIVVIIPAKDFMGPVIANLRNTALLGLLVLVVATGIGAATARYIIRPLLKVIDVADAIEDGNYDLEPLEAVSERTDELGNLARVFRDMAQEVYRREQALKKQVRELELMIKVDEEKKAEQVSEIVDSDFFRDLQVKARTLRQQRDNRDDEGTAADTAGEKASSD